MTDFNLITAEAYYTAVGEKNLTAAASYLHPDIQLITPLASLQGKAEVLEAVKNFMKIFNTLKIRSSFSSSKQALIVYDLSFPEPIASCSTVALLTIEQQQITQAELFYDPRPFVAMQNQIFSQPSA